MDLADDDLFECQQCLGTFDIEESVRPGRKGDDLLCAQCAGSDNSDVTDVIAYFSSKRGVTIFEDQSPD